MGSLDWHVTMLDIHLQRLVDPLSWTCWNQGKMTEQLDWWEKIIHHDLLGSRNTGSVEELETVSAGKNPKTSRHRSPGEERRRERHRWTIYPERTREDHCHASVQHRTYCFQSNIGNTRETGWSTYGLSRALRFHLELNWTEVNSATTQFNDVSKIAFKSMNFRQLTFFAKICKKTHLRFNLKTFRDFEVSGNALQSFEQAKGAS